MSGSERSMAPHRRAQVPAGERVPSAGTAALFEEVYGKLRALAQLRFRRLRATSTLQPTALVHEVYLRIALQDPAAFHDREHLLAVAATAMRQIVIDQARRRNAGKRGGGWARVTRVDLGSTQDAAVDLLALDQALTELTELQPRQARIVELRVFAELTVAEVAGVLGVSTATVEKDWHRARAWLRVQLARGR